MDRICGMGMGNARCCLLFGALRDASAIRFPRADVFPRCFTPDRAYSRLRSKGQAGQLSCCPAGGGRGGLAASPASIRDFHRPFGQAIRRRRRVIIQPQTEGTYFSTTEWQGERCAKASG